MSTENDYQDPKPTGKTFDPGTFGRMNTHHRKNSTLGGKIPDNFHSKKPSFNYNSRILPYQYHNLSPGSSVTPIEEDLTKEDISKEDITISPRFTSIPTPTRSSSYNMLDNSVGFSKTKRDDLRDLDSKTLRTSDRNTSHININETINRCQFCQQTDQTNNSIRPCGCKALNNILTQQDQIISKNLEKPIQQCVYCLTSEPKNTLINPCKCEQQWHQMCLKQSIIDQKKTVLFNQGNFTCEVCSSAYKILRIEKISINLLKQRKHLTIKFILCLLLILSVVIGLSAWLIKLSQQQHNAKGFIIFSLMVLFILAMVSSSYLILELIRLATQVSWTLVNRFEESPYLMQVEYLNMFIENGIIEKQNKIPPIL